MICKKLTAVTRSGWKIQVQQEEIADQPVRAGNYAQTACRLMCVTTFLKCCYSVRENIARKHTKPMYMQQPHLTTENTA